MPPPSPAPEDRRPSCRQSDCPVAASGLCLEGFEAPAEDCPHFQWADSAASPDPELIPTPDGDPERPTSTPSQSLVALPGGDALLAAETRAVTHAHAPTVVAIVGPPDSGKTTLIAGLWDGLAQGPVGDYAFAGSETQPGLERIAFPARTGSGNTRPKTNHTSRSRGVRYLHLAVRDRERRRATSHLLVSDIPGEFVKDAAESADGFASLGLLHYADHVLLLVNGGALADPARRQQAIARTRSFLGNGIDSGAIPLGARLDAAVTKWDLVERAAPSDPLVMASVAKVERMLDDRLGGRPHAYSLRRIAARPVVSSALDSRFGLADLLHEWVRIPPRASREPYRPAPHPDDRESTRYLWRRLARV